MSSISNGLGQVMTGALAQALSGGFMRIFTGPAPAGPELAETGTLLGVVCVNGVSGAGLHYDALGNMLTKAGAERWIFQAAASGNAAWFRIVAPGDTGDDDPTAARIQGSIGTADAPGDMVWDTLAVTQGTHYTIDSLYMLVQPTTPTG